MGKIKVIVLVVALLLLVGAGVYWWVYTQSEGYQAEKFVKDLERQYREDTVGGSTSEETLQLFIEALKRGDTELAARYFIVDEQEQWREDLARLKEKRLLDAMVRDLERPFSKYPLVPGEEDSFVFEIRNEQDELIAQMNIARGPNGVWKIVDF